MSSEKAKLAEKANTIFIYCVVVVLAAVLVLSFFPVYNIKIETSQLVLVLIIVVLLLFRYFRVIEIPGFLKLSKEIEAIKSETKEIKQAQMTLMQAFTVSQSASASSLVQILVNQAAKDAGEEAETLLSEPPSVNVTDLTASLEAIKSETDQIELHVRRREYAAAFLLMRRYIDTLLKDIIGVGQAEPRSFHELLRDVKKRELLRPPLLESILSVRRFANTVIHMPPSAERDLIPDEVNKIGELGIRVIGELESIKRRQTIGN